MVNNTTSVIQCVRCESKDEIKPYIHKTPDIQITKTRRHYTQITTFRGTGGKGLVPVCSHCHREFTYWKLYKNILFILNSIFFLLFLAYIIIVAAKVMEHFTGDFTPLPTNVDYVLLVFSGTISLLLFISIRFVNNLDVNPHKSIAIMKNEIFIKPIKASRWNPIESYMSSALLREWRQKTGIKKYQPKTIYI